VTTQSKIDEWGRSPGPGRLVLGPDERQFVSAKWKKIRKSQRLADRASNRWEQISAELNDYLDRSQITDIVVRARTRSTSIALIDAYDDGKWHSANAQRHIDDLALFLRLKELGLL
jgi:hypothetical protein